MNSEFLVLLLKIAASLSGYDMPDELPDVFYVEHEWLERNACLLEPGEDPGKKCKKVGAWYNDQSILYVDVKFHGSLRKQPSGMIVHELVHYLQDVSGEFEGTCDEFVEREREAYWVQYQYLQQTFGTLAPMHQNYMACAQ